jgi:mono/diheme cytochrome c family protein
MFKFHAVCALGLVVSMVGSGQSAAVTSSEVASKVEGTQLIQSVEGGALFKAYCAACHGTDAKGAGPMAKWLKVKTPDLTRISSRSKGRFPLARLQRIISGQENVQSGHGTREMPVWGPIFSQVESDRDWGRMRVYNLAQFIQTLQQKN